jgi:hypothetical protein
MRKTMKKIILFLLVFLIVSCSSKDIFISPEYKNEKIQNAILYISSINEFKIRHTENIFNESELTLINKKLVTTINEQLKPNLYSQTTFSKIDFIDLNGKINFNEKKLEFNDNNFFTFKIPSNKLETNDTNVFILLIESFSVSIFKKERESSDPAKTFSISNPTPAETKLAPAKLADQIMSCEFKFMIWDNDKQKPVNYGYVNFENKFEENDDIDKMLTKIVENISTHIIKKSPFKI